MRPFAFVLWTVLMYKYKHLALRLEGLDLAYFTDGL